MPILLAFSPFLAFALLDRLLGPTPGLVAGALAAAGLLLRDRLAGRAPKLLEIGTLILFGALALVALILRPDWSVIAVRLAVDAGLLLIVLASLALRRPFTLQYAREQVAPALWNSPGFLRTNMVITGVWALAFAVMVAAEAALLVVPGLPPKLGILAIVLALVGAIKFTGWYPDRVRARHAA
ncbi:hypothetical protein [Roseicella sp. DB1501]|uniref:hypothetical protein n=1 Tax=Roseicella sp. DB1501 TaxID=2730925 RepID=UPI0014920CBA|nr:hypothetical protein [Roseicella sp. DB1501]NOG69515.1 hypothetical protein [Roseicella sp. DB1501]